MSTLDPVRITDTTLRDGSHAVRHQFTRDNVRQIAQALDEAGVPVIEVSHGDGLNGSSFNYGFSATEELELIGTAASVAKKASIAVLLLPGIGTTAHLKAAHEAGARIARIATHSTEADVSIQHFSAARELDMETVGFLMLSHRVEPAALATQARIMVDAGCQCVYVVDSAGALLPDGARDRVAALVDEIGAYAQVGFHGHQNLYLGVANSLAAYRAGARQIDATLRGLGAGAGNTPTEVLVTVLEAMGVPTGIEVDAVIDAAEDLVRPLMAREQVADRGSIMQGRFGVYNSFLLHAERAAARYGVSPAELLRRVGEIGYVGGQEDMIIDTALQLSEVPR